MTSLRAEHARYWTSPLLPGAELLTATFSHQRFTPHWHETYVVPVIQSGAQSYRYRGATRVAPSGSVAAINPGEVHTGERAARDGWTYRAFYPTVDWMRRMASDAGRPDTAPSFPDEVITDAGLALQLVDAHERLEAGRDVLAAETALHRAFVSLIARHARGRRTIDEAPRDEIRVARMRERLAEAIAEPITLSQLAAHVALSPFHAARMFSAAVGMPPHAWRNQVRINRACDLLRRGCSVTETALAAGFFDQSHFAHHFVRALGVPPGAFARTYKRELPGRL
jgi:AraC-like DNA-binding protein